MRYINSQDSFLSFKYNQEVVTVLLCFGGHLCFYHFKIRLLQLILHGLKIDQKLKLVQNRSAFLLNRMSCHKHIQAMLDDLHWLPEGFQVNFKLFVSFTSLKNRLYFHVISCD